MYQPPTISVNMAVYVDLPYLCLGVGTYSSATAIRHSKGTLLDRVDVFKFAVRQSPTQSQASVAYQPRSWQIVASPGN